MFSLGGLFGTKKPLQQVAITPPEVPPTTTPQNQTIQPDKPDTRQAIYSLRTKMESEVYSTYKPQLHQFIQGISGEIYNTSLNSQITEQINTIISELYSKSKEELIKINPAITVDMFETGNIQLPDKISQVFQLKTKEYLAQLEEFYLKRIASVLHDKFDPLLPDMPSAPKRPVEPKPQASYELTTDEQEPDYEQFDKWRRGHEGGSLSRFSKKKKKTKKKRRATKRSKKRSNN
uniref:Uncharacterized protein n=1 Tax=viral metagenome TaxID=1070528 RepID=A0A6C0DWK7_9ZZZZ